MPLQFNDYVQPICLPKSDTDVVSRVVSSRIGIFMPPLYSARDFGEFLELTQYTNIFQVMPGNTAWFTSWGHTSGKPEMDS